MKRLRNGLEIIGREHPDAILSVDTFRADVARMCVEEYGVAIVNDIAAGNMDSEMFSTIARLGVPYIMMHMQELPKTCNSIRITKMYCVKCCTIFLKRYSVCAIWE